MRLRLIQRVLWAGAALGLTAAVFPDSLKDERQAFLAGINAARQPLAPLLLSPTLSQVAQARAQEYARPDRSLKDASIARASSALAAAGYDARLLSEVSVESTDGIEKILEEARGGQEPLADEIRRDDVRDLGVGLSVRVDTPVYVFLFALSWSDFLAAKRAEFADLPRIRRALLDRINHERAKVKLPPLRAEPKLDAAAQGHAADMLGRSYYGHTSPEGATVLERSKGAGYLPQMVGENIAEGQETIERVVADWMASPGHREHILSRLFVDVGSGVSVGTNARGHEILWVQCFGRPVR